MYFGSSYDLLKGNPLTNQTDPGFMHAIFDFTYNHKETTEDGHFLIPDGLSHRKTSSCAFTSSSNTYRGVSSYQSQLKTRASVEAGYKGGIFDASFSVSVGYQDMKKKTMDTSRSFTHATASCEAYQIAVDLFKPTKLLPNFVTGVVNSVKYNNWTLFLEQYGTHFTYDVTLGGRATQ